MKNKVILNNEHSLSTRGPWQLLLFNQPTNGHEGKAYVVVTFVRKTLFVIILPHSCTNTGPHHNYGLFIQSDYCCFWLCITLANCNVFCAVGSCVSCCCAWFCSPCVLFQVLPPAVAGDSVQLQPLVHQTQVCTGLKRATKRLPLGHWGGTGSFYFVCASACCYQTDDLASINGDFLKFYFI